jgi:threonine dehydrogenase-like Zn-dependent dehydrogenase
VLVEIGACGLCTLDRRLFSGAQPIYPVVPGHEPAGRVIEVGAAVGALPGAPVVGDMVTIDLRTRCGTCAVCRRGRSAICLASQSRKRSDGLVGMAAGLSEVLAVDALQAWPVGDAPIEHAAMGEPLACVVHSLRRGGFQPGDRVAVVGGGYMGRLHLSLARLQGAAHIGVVDVDSDRRAEAAAAGASWTAAPDEAASAGGEHEIVVVTAGAPGSLEVALQLCAKGASIILYGAFPKGLEVPVNPDEMHRQELSVIGVHSHEPEDWRVAAGLLASGVLAGELAPLVTARFSLADSLRGFELAAAQPVYRVLVGG